MNRVVSWFYGKQSLPQSTEARADRIQSLIVQKQIKEFRACLRQKDDRKLCIEGFFNLLSTILDDRYMSSLFELILRNARLTPTEVSTLIIGKLSSAIRARDFDLCERILRLPLPSLRTSLPTYEFTQLIHKCSNSKQLMDCLAILIEKHLPHDSEYVTWIMIVLLEQFVSGDEIILEYLLNIKEHTPLLFHCYSHRNVTPLMLFFHLYSNEKCQILLDRCLSNISDQSVLLQCDQWGRSYLTHLLAGQCQHSLPEDSIEIREINEQVIDRCPHAKAILSRFSMLHKLGSKCTMSTKMIFTSQYCLALKMTLFDYLLKNEPTFSLDCGELFSSFPPTSISTYTTYLKQLVHNNDLGPALRGVILDQSHRNIDPTIEFLLRQGARIDDMSSLHTVLSGLVSHHRSMIPFMLINYGMYTDIPFQGWSYRHSLRESLYVYRLLQCGYPSEFRAKFDEFQTYLLQSRNYPAEKFLDLKVPTRLSRLCLQKVRCSLRNLGEETTERLKDYLPDHLRRSVTYLGYGECPAFFRSVMSST